MRRAAWLAMSVMLLAGLVLAALPGRAAAPTGDTSAGGRCVWHEEYLHTIRDLGSNPTRWSVVPGAEIDPYGGYVEYDHGRVRIADDLPCGVVADVVRHEWMHVQQVRLHGGREGIRRAFGDRDEIVADCGSQLLGSSYTPYIDRAVERRGVACTSRDIADALALIGYPSWAEAAHR